MKIHEIQRFTCVMRAFYLVPSFCVGMPSSTLCVLSEREQMRTRSVQDGIPTQSVGTRAPVFNALVNRSRPRWQVRPSPLFCVTQWQSVTSGGSPNEPSADDKTKP